MAKPDRDARIKAKAYELWEIEGRPAWQHERHWDHAKSLIDQEDALEEGLQPSSIAGAVSRDYDPLSEGEPPPGAPPAPRAKGPAKSPAKPPAKPRARKASAP